MNETTPNNSAGDLAQDSPESVKKPEPGSWDYEKIATDPLFNLFPKPNAFGLPDKYKTDGHGTLSVVRNQDVDIDSSVSPLVQPYISRLNTLISVEWKDFLAKKDIPPENAFMDIVEECNFRFQAGLEVPIDPWTVAKFFQIYEKLKVEKDILNKI
jgi:hypothetical protein